MSDYAFVADRAKKAFASVARLERRFEENPNDRAIHVNLAAMKKVALQARDELERLAELNRIEICQYRLVPIPTSSYGLGNVAQSLLEYQNLFSQIYDALKNGKKLNATIGKDTASESTLEFGYTYSGSLGVALLARGQRDLISGKFDSSIDALFEIIDIDNARAVREVAEQLGRAVIKRVHDWSKANADAGFSADVRWKRSDGRLFGKMIDRARMERLVGFIEEASDESSELIAIRGMLVAVSLPQRTFQLVVPGSTAYSGHFPADMILPNEVTVGRFYDAEIEVSEVTYYATQLQKRTNTLVHLSGPVMDLSF